MNEPSPLHEMFRLQKEFNLRVGCDPTTMTDEDRDMWIQNYYKASAQELSELLDCTTWKWWRKSVKFDQQNAKVEVIDLFHFLISIAQVLGMTADDVFEAYLKKNQVNHARQDTGYVTKDPDDCRHI